MTQVSESEALVFVNEPEIEIVMPPVLDYIRSEFTSSVHAQESLECNFAGHGGVPVGCLYWSFSAAHCFGLDNLFLRKINNEYCLKFYSPNGSWNYVKKKQFWNITRGIYAKYRPTRSTLNQTISGSGKLFGSNEFWDCLHHVSNANEKDDLTAQQREALKTKREQR